MAKGNIFDNLNPFGKPATVTGNDPNKPGTSTGAPATPATGTQLTPEQESARIHAFYESQGLFNGLDYQAFAKMLGVEDSAGVEGVKLFMQDVAKNAARVALVAANKVTDSKLAKAQKELETRTVAATRDDAAIETMHKQLKFTRDPAVAPVAENVMRGFVTQGQTHEQAIESTKKYFEATTKLVAESTGMQVQPRGRQPGSRPFASDAGKQSSQQNNNTGDATGGGDGDEPDADDWLNVLSGGTHQAPPSQPQGGGGDGAK